MCRIKYQFENETNTDSPSNLPILFIKFRFDTLFIGRVDEQERVHSRSLQIKLFHSATYMSPEKFYRVLEDNLCKKLWGEVFDENDRRVFIEDMIEEIHEIIGDECNRGRQRLDVSVHMILFVSDLVKLIWKMENDENADCIICFEELGKERERICMPCSHMFHEDCITTWLQIGHSCPICRYDLRAI
ncbi:probable E3 ubiquitin-protein ligase RHY1A [Solanum verrucosum]|uniref:probable E3 ubiquitin-protein ligase RHY1A n=1 Tax=Solanum verrucosum TaxID=315347 RepID=UPI0020CFF841|nr:probable E3 ubiquitin-protein ligase RHY1A [Solanum verrucosum]